MGQKMCHPQNLWEVSGLKQGIYSSFYANLAPFECWQKITFLVLLFVQITLCLVLFYIYRREKQNLINTKNEGETEDTLNESRRSLVSP